MRLTDEATLPGRALVPLRQFRDTIEQLRAELPVARDQASPRAHARGERVRGRARARRFSREPGSAREPGRAAGGRCGLRGPRGGREPLGFPGPRGARLGDRSPERRRPRPADDAARSQGTRVRVGVPGRARGGAAAALAEHHERGGSRGGAPALLRRHDAGDGAAPPVVGAQPPGLRPAAGQPAEPVSGRDPARGGGAEAAASPRPLRGWSRRRSRDGAPTDAGSSGSQRAAVAPRRRPARSCVPA